MHPSHCNLITSCFTDGETKAQGGIKTCLWRQLRGYETDRPRQPNRAEKEVEEVRLMEGELCTYLNQKAAVTLLGDHDH